MYKIKVKTFTKLSNEALLNGMSLLCHLNNIKGKVGITDKLGDLAIISLDRDNIDTINARLNTDISEISVKKAVADQMMADFSRLSPMDSIRHEHTQIMAALHEGNFEIENSQDIINELLTLKTKTDIDHLTNIFVDSAQALTDAISNEGCPDQLGKVKFEQLQNMVAHHDEILENNPSTMPFGGQLMNMINAAAAVIGSAQQKKRDMEFAFVKLEFINGLSSAIRDFQTFKEDQESEFEYKHSM